VPVKSGGDVAGLTTSVKVLTAFGAMPLLAVTVIEVEPAVVGVPESTPAVLIVIPPATGVGLNANVGTGEPVIPVNEKEYGEPTMPAVGVPVKLGAEVAAAAGSVMVRNTWSAVAALLFDDTRNWQFVKSGRPLAGDAWPGAKQLKMP
jgi:hypothetical protein